MQKHFERKTQEGEEMRKLVEQTMMEHENTKEARKKLQEYKQKLGKTRKKSIAIRLLFCNRLGSCLIVMHSFLIRI